MNEFDRYDLAGSILIGVIAMIILVLGAPIWTPVPIYAVWIIFGAFRHLDIDEMLPDQIDHPRRVVLLVHVIHGVQRLSSHLPGVASPYSRGRQEG